MADYRWFPSSRRGGLQELQMLVNDLEALLEGGRDMAADELPAFKARLHHLLDQSRDNSQRVIRRSRRALRAGGEYVGEHPWQTSLVLAITCGVLAACVMSRHH